LVTQGTDSGPDVNEGRKRIASTYMLKVCFICLNDLMEVYNTEMFGKRLTLSSLVELDRYLIRESTRLVNIPFKLRMKFLVFDRGQRKLGAPKVLRKGHKILSDQTKECVGDFQFMDSKEFLFFQDIKKTIFNLKKKKFSSLILFNVFLHDPK
jgi:hypothetical protein